MPHDYSIVQTGGNDPHTDAWCIDCNWGDTWPGNDNAAYRIAHQAGTRHKRNHTTQKGPTQP